MKRYLFIFIVVLLPFLARAQYKDAAYIVDPDGYVNVRQGADSKSAIIAKLYSGTTVYYNANSSANWLKVSINKNGEPLGYIHSSRLARDNWPLSANISDADGNVTNIRDLPKGNIVLKLPTKNNYMIYLSDYQDSWWKIDRIVRVDEDFNEYPISVPSSGYWIHTSCISTGIAGDGDIAVTVLNAPKKNASVVKKYPLGYYPVITGVLDLSADKLFIKVRFKDGTIGWVSTSIVCSDC